MIHWVICPVVNGFHNTLRAVESFLRQDIPGGVRVLLIDNSDDRLGWKIQQWDAHTKNCVVVVDRDEDRPRSVARSWNIGVNYAFSDLNRELNPHRVPLDQMYCLVAANDVILKPETYRLLVDSDLPFVTPVGVGNVEQMKQESRPEVLSPHPDFSCFLVRRPVFEKAGAFDESYPGLAYCEDGEYHLRLHRAGIKAGSISVPFFHEVSATIKQADPTTAAGLRDGAALNRAWFKQKFGFEQGSPEYYESFK